MAFVRGARTGASMILMPSDANTASKDEVNFVSRSRMRNLTPATCPVSSVQRLRACWVNQSVAGLAVTPAIRVSWWMKKST